MKSRIDTERTKVLLLLATFMTTHTLTSLPIIYRKQVDRVLHLEIVISLNSALILSGYNRQLSTIVLRLSNLLTRFTR